MHRGADLSPALRLYLSLNSAAFIIAGVLMIAVARSGSLSGLRLIMIGGMLFVGAALAALAIILHLNPIAAQAAHQAIFDSPLRKRLTPVFGIAFPIFWTLTWFPPASTGDLYYYFIGFYPFFVCGTLASGSALILLLGSRVASTGVGWTDYWREHRVMLNITLVALAVFALVAVVTAALGILSGREPYWYGAGVPILASQVFLAALITVIGLHIQARPWRVRLPVDLILFLLIWVLAAALWASQPVRESYWVTAPRAPNFEAYPFSDLAVFDVASQFALIGQGINNHAFFDRGLYMAFLVYLHSIGGQNYQTLMALQAALFAVFPALLYLVGKRLHSRAAGILVAVLITLRGLNSLSAAAWIDTATFKHMLTDFPAAICLAVLVLLLLKWLEAPAENARYLLWIGGLLGLGSLLRPHVVLVLAAILVLALWVYRGRWRRAVLMAALTLVTAFAAVAPWMFLSPGAGSFFALYGQRIRDVMAQRYPAFRPVPTASAPSVATEVPGVQVTPAAIATPMAEPTTAPLPPQPAPPAAKFGIPFQVTQYVHNLVSSGLIFPDSPLFLSVKETVKGGEPFWEPHWDGSISGTAAVMLVLGLLAVALGLGVAFQRLGWVGLMPLAVLLIYYVANALARTSGGRYLVPVDWILVCYFGIGLTELLSLGGRVVGVGEAGPIETAERQRTARLLWLSPAEAVTAVVGILLIGGLIPLAGVLYPLRYPPKPPAEIVGQMQPGLTDIGWQPPDVSAFLSQPGAVALYGRALYPRFYAQGTGEPVRYLPFREANYPRTVFIFIGPAGAIYTILPGPVPKVLPNASDVTVLGCRAVDEGYDVLSAVAVVVTARGESYVRSPMAPLTCPMPVPKCDAAGACR